jgi:hypothetical protein
MTTITPSKTPMQTLYPSVELAIHYTLCLDVATKSYSDSRF